MSVFHFDRCTILAPVLAAACWRCVDLYACGDQVPRVRPAARLHTPASRDAPHHHDAPRARHGGPGHQRWGYPVLSDPPTPSCRRPRSRHNILYYISGLTLLYGRASIFFKLAHPARRNLEVHTYFLTQIIFAVLGFYHTPFY